jgi:hypothetical protein
MERAPIGLAADFYRIRLRRLDAPAEADLEWRDDILYREPPQGGSGPLLVYVVEAVDVDDLESAHPIGSFSAYEEALGLQAKVSEDLAELTRSQFEKAWFSEP